MKLPEITSPDLTPHRKFCFQNEVEEELNHYFAGTKDSDRLNESLAPPREYKVVQPKPGNDENSI